MIRGYLKSSYIDYPGNISSVLFYGGCNFRCPFCHNRDIVSRQNCESIKLNEILSDLDKRKDFIDGVVITGGEPCMCQEHESHISKIKDMGLRVKLDTNGSKPEVLKIILSKNDLDYIAMDIKGEYLRYNEIVDINIDTELIDNSIDLIKYSGVSHEFRTTIIKEFHNYESLKKICRRLGKGEKLVLQQYQYSDKQIKDIKYDTYSGEELNDFKLKLQDEFGLEIETRYRY
jgi:pyruvate formate lyase activating enzyme